MGAWGTGITQDDTTADVIGFMVDRMKGGDSLEAASQAALAKFRSLSRDRDEAPLLWLALAEVQWKYGVPDPAVLTRVRADIEQGHGLDPWREDPKLLAKRQAALSKFLAKIEAPNPKPARPPSRTVRQAPFEPGDCISVQLPEGKYTAALVLRADNSNPELGKNLVACLDYYEDAPPDLSVFESRPWLKLEHGQWDGRLAVLWFLPARMRAAKKSLTVVGRIPTRNGDPSDSPMFTAWANAGQFIAGARLHSTNQAG